MKSGWYTVHAAGFNGLAIGDQVCFLQTEVRPQVWERRVWAASKINEPASYGRAVVQQIAYRRDGKQRVRVLVTADRVAL